jgi:hypothetical protein
MISWRDFWLGVALPTVIFIGVLTLVVFLTHGCSSGPASR